MRIVVLFLCIGLLAGCGQSSTANFSSGEEPTYRRAIREVNWVGSSLVITTTVGEVYMVDAGNVTVLHDRDNKDGTYCDIQKSSTVSGKAYRASQVTILASSEEERQSWRKAIDAIFEKYYQPRKILPPPIS